MTKDQMVEYQKELRTKISQQKCIDIISILKQACETKSYIRLYNDDGCYRIYNDNFHKSLVLYDNDLQWLSDLGYNITLPYTELSVRGRGPFKSRRRIYREGKISWE